MFSAHPLADRQLRWFGLSLTALILLVGWLMARRWESDGVLVGAVVTAVAFASIFYGVPASRRPLYRGFGICVYPLQVIATFVLLGIVYFGVLTPIGIYLRLRGYDPLKRRGAAKPNSAGTDWVTRDPAPPDERYFKTY